MASAMPGRDGRRLERSCDWMRVAPGSPGIERIEASLSGHAFEPHRHDTYSIGYTTAGVQSFGYRGAPMHSLPGQVFVLHPDELHDGHAGTDAVFRYRTLYIEPRLIRAALGDSQQPLPFVQRPVSDDARLCRAVRAALDDLDTPLDELERDQAVAELAEALAAADPSLAPRRLSHRDGRAVERARELLDASVATGVSSAELEAATGVDRYALARHFRACLGTSPYRYLVMRRLEHTRALLQRGVGLVDAALASGFADQSHMTRHFKKVYGMTPGRWASLLAT